MAKAKLKPAPRTTTVAGVLGEASRLIRRGWTRGTFYRKGHGRESYCLLGACNEAALGSYARKFRTTYAARTLKQEALQLLIGVLKSRRHHAPEYLASFNDEQTTKKPVLALLAEARRRALSAAR